MDLKDSDAAFTNAALARDVARLILAHNGHNAARKLNATVCVGGAKARENVTVIGVSIQNY